MAVSTWIMIMAMIASNYVHRASTDAVNYTDQQLADSPTLFEGDMYLDRDASAGGLALLGANMRWPSGIVPYEISSIYPSEQRDTIMGAMRKMEKFVSISNVRCIQFRPRTSNDTAFISIVNGTGCSSYIGLTPGFATNRTVTLQHPGCLTDGRIMHQFMHVLGFVHEQSRPDRDNYVRINLTNVKTGFEINFQKYNTSILNRSSTPYDYGSLMHLRSDAFSKNGYSTIIPLVANVSIGQRGSLSAIDIQKVRAYYNCSANGVPLPTDATTTWITTTYSSAWTSNSQTYSRPFSPTSSASYYFEVFQVVVATTGNYTIKIACSAATYSYLYSSNFNPQATTANMLAYNANDAGGTQAGFSYILQGGTTYYAVFTPSAPSVTATYAIIVFGVDQVKIIRLNGPSTTPAVAIMTGTARTIVTEAVRTTTMKITTTMTPAVNTTYSSSFSSGNQTFTRPLGQSANGSYYFDVLQVSTTVAGTYTFVSLSNVNSFGIFYAGSFNPAYPYVNLLTYNDDYGNNNQYGFKYSLKPGVNYYVVSTSNLPSVTAAYTLLVSGPVSVNIVHADIPKMMPIGRCVGSMGDPICPAQVQTTGTIVTFNNTRLSNGGSIAVNKLFFNLDDIITTKGFVQTVQVQYDLQRYPNSNAQIWIYSVMPVAGGFIICSQYAVPAAQISTTQQIQVYTIPDNVINLVNGSYVGIGIQDSSATVMTTYGGLLLYVDSADKTKSSVMHETLYFEPTSSRAGAKLSYTIIT